MTRLSWNEISARAATFAAEWAGETYEKGESQSFWTAFLDVFGIHRRRAGGYFEYAVRLGGGRYGFIDMFLPGKLIVEQKSAGRDLTTATSQALGYLDGIPDHDLPYQIVACDFQSFDVYETETRTTTSFALADLPRHVRLFGRLIDDAGLRIEEQTPVNREAAERMATLHNQLFDSGYRGHKLELFLVRIVFCLFADDAEIFEPRSFETYVRQRTSSDGTDLGPRLGKLFEILATPVDQRSRALDADLAAFPYLNGGLFSELIPMPDFDQTTRMLLIQTSRPDWSQVSPAIFGSMFQGVLDEEQRHEVGAHYTSEENILRVIKPLFLDDLYAEFESIKNTPRELTAFHRRLAALGFLDPACGCGNFLVIAYRELRRLEHRVLAAIQGDRVTLTDVADLLKVRIEQFSGIEILEFPALIAHVALWLTDHQMNREASARFGRAYARIPLTEGAHIVHANALTTDWATVRAPHATDYILGNPPFLGSRVMDRGQKAEVRSVAVGIREAGFLDFVVAWYLLADRFMAENPAIEAALVSTNSVSQGEQPGIFWPRLLAGGQHLNFAHRTFVWTNSGRGVAHVHCVIIGFSRAARATKQLYSYPDERGEPVLDLVRSISPYLIPGDEYVVGNRQAQISGARPMAFGNMAADGGNLVLDRATRDALVARYPEAERWVRPFVGAEEFINGRERFCLWLVGATPAQLRAIPLIYERVRANRETRAASARPQLAAVPELFAQRTVDPDRPFLLVPRTSSERRRYVPMGFIDDGSVVSDGCLAIPDAELWEFALLTSETHMDWLRTVGGRLKSDYRYSKDVVYNNFVLPALDEAERTHLAELGQAILDARTRYPDDTLADLYDDVTMPAGLRAAHLANDRYVDALFGFDAAVIAPRRVARLLALHRERTRAAGGRT